jgi:hypothetical protein
MDKQARQMNRKVKAMTRREIITKAIDGQLSWVAAADIIGVSARHLRPIRPAIERDRISAVIDQRGGRPRRKRMRYPNVYRDSFAWKAKIVALLDQYGDEPTSQLCNENPGTHS